ncbi:MAG: HAMP domain-containing protein, partial [Bdellovibrionales bacterium]|nr:HAMP domain-containing protein [Bdellovibrionales bacterium]
MRFHSLRLKKDYGRLLLKIFVAYFLTALLICGGIFATLRTLSTTPQLPEVFEDNLVWHLANLRTELGQPPTEEKVRRLEAEFHLKVRTENFEVPGITETLPTFADVDQARDLRVAKNLRLGRSGRYFFAEISGQSPRTVWFVSPDTFQKNSSLLPFVWFTGFVLFILGMSFLSIRWMMKPLSLLFEGARELSEGNLSFRMPISHRGGFREIAEDFNEIAEKLQRQVQNRDILIRDVSHELRSPLTRMSVAVEMIREANIKDSLREDVERMSQLIQQILESYRIRSGGLPPRKARIDVIELIRGVTEEDPNLNPKVI